MDLSRAPVPQRRSRHVRRSRRARLPRRPRLLARSVCRRPAPRTTASSSSTRSTTSRSPSSTRPSSAAPASPSRDGAAEGGHAVLARNFDFEAGPIFDEHKAVFLMREEGRIPYASVAWPGLMGAVTGMNAEGVALVVHGGRAREPRARGRARGAHHARGARRRARRPRRWPSSGRRNPWSRTWSCWPTPRATSPWPSARPGAGFVRRGRGKVPLTNHFEGPLRPTPRTSHRGGHLHPRAPTRLDELFRIFPGASVERVVAVLRDQKGGGAASPLGDRRTIDALIATHAVVMDATARSSGLARGLTWSAASSASMSAPSWPLVTIRAAITRWSLRRPTRKVAW